MEVSIAAVASVASVVKSVITVRSLLTLPSNVRGYIALTGERVL